MAMVSESKPARSALDRPISSALAWLTWERALYILLFLVALGLRLWALGARAMSHDESIHALFSFDIARGRPYVHDPTYHGPLLYYVNAVVNALLGDSDFTARLAPAIIGSILVVLPFMLRKWLSRSGALLAAVMLTVSPIFVYFSRYIRHDIYVSALTLIVAIAAFRYFDDRRPQWIVVAGIAAILSLASMEATYIAFFIFLLFLVVVLIWERISDARAQWLRPALLVVAALALLVEAIVARATANDTGQAATGGLALLVPYLTLFAMLLVATSAAWYAARGREREYRWLEALRAVSRKTWLITLGAVVVIFVLLYTSFFTNARGLVTGTVGQLSYWLGEHKGGAGRGGQPWYYHLLEMSMYEFLPLLGAVAATIYYSIRGLSKKAHRDSQPVVSFLIFWWVLAVAIFGWAGEKMPQHSLHQVLPMMLLTGRFMRDLLAGIDWRAAWRRGAWAVAALLPVTAYTLIRLVSVAPFRGVSLQDLSRTMMWLSAFVVAGLLVYALVRYFRRVGGATFWRVAVATALVCLLAITVRLSWLANYINYDNARELLAYAHGTQDIKLTMNEISEISKRTVGDNQIKVAYDSDSTWPLEWYMREFPNKAFYGDNPTRETMDAPVVIVGSVNESKVKPFLGTKYYRFERRLVWWPIEDYKGATIQRVFKELKDPAKRQEIWNIIWYRDFKFPLNSWPMIHNFTVFIRKDVAAQMWQYGVGPSGPAEVVEDPFEKKQVLVASVQSIGQSGSEVGQLKEPRVAAVDSQGNIYVGDSGNRRVQVFDSTGKFLRQWGKEGAGDGEFTEIWGIAVGPDGSVYVSDTWNYRVQKFDSQGKFLAQAGTFGESGDKADSVPGQFYGPRTIAIDSQGFVYVADTGNKRIQKLTADLQFVAAFGGPGVLDGQFEEPVGLAIDAQGNIYVADTWNQRIQKFDAQMNFVAKWEVPTWEGESVMNKPYLAVDSRGYVYASDPESFRVIQYTVSGELVAVTGEFGQGATQFNLPIGLAVDGKNNLYVVDAANNRVQEFAPLGQ